MFFPYLFEASVEIMRSFTASKTTRYKRVCPQAPEELARERERALQLHVLIAKARQGPKRRCCLGYLEREQGAWSALGACVVLCAKRR